MSNGFGCGVDQALVRVRTWLGNILRHLRNHLPKNEILYWNGLDLDWHTHVYLDAIGPEAFESLGMEQLK